MYFFEILGSIMNGCMKILQLPLTFGGITISLWMCLLGGAVIAIVAKLIWGAIQ
jgi:hypothetical protein